MSPSNTTDTLKWSSSNTKVAKVSSTGVVTAVEKGTATITVKTTSGKTATCKVTVKIPSTKVDNDEVKGADNKITVFINCKIQDSGGKVIGVVCVGLVVDSLKKILQKYEKESEIGAYFLDDEGIIQISTAYTGYEKTDWFKIRGNEHIRDKILGWKKETSDLDIWTKQAKDGVGKSFISTRYMR